MIEYDKQESKVYCYKEASIEICPFYAELLENQFMVIMKVWKRMTSLLPSLLSSSENVQKENEKNSDLKSRIFHKGGGIGTCCTVLVLLVVCLMIPFAIYMCATSESIYVCSLQAT
ncbi:unnamed protein product [Cylicocyclus nassatus]|uniref:Uncharacterized protein n=1 Tax=Cylicocyclus nassatus TaxID=53992 RepID=A0AA36DTY4_CYLNA|nr:unnamed protein product [Cylicocyclus nassatus]